MYLAFSFDFAVFYMGKQISFFCYILVLLYNVLFLWLGRVWWHIFLNLELYPAR